MSRAIGPIVFVLGCLLCGLSPASTEGQRRCGGGGSEGPKPVTDLAGFKSDAVLVSTHGEVSDFVYWERSNRLLYRNAQQGIFVASPNTGEGAFIATSSKPLSRLIDDNERFAATEGETWALDSFSGSWFQYTGVPAPHHVFWNAANLYSLGSVYDPSDSLRVYRYPMATSYAKRICPRVKLAAADGYHVANGHAYPHILLYRTVDLGGAYELTLFTLNVSTCAVKNVGTYKHLVEGKIRSVHWFPALDSVAVRVEHPRKQLLWDTGPGGCRYIEFGDRDFMVPNPRVPILATYSAKGGLSLVYLSDADKPKEAQVLKDVPIQAIGPRDLQLTDDGQRLLVSPVFADNSRWLLEVRLTAPQIPAR